MLVLGAAFVALNVVLPPEKSLLEGTVLAAVDSQSDVITGTGFREGGAYSGVEGQLLASNIKVFGSWMGSDANTGTSRTRRYRAEETFYVGSSGYANGRDLKLEVELECR